MITITNYVPGYGARRKHYQKGDRGYDQFSNSIKHAPEYELSRNIPTVKVQMKKSYLMIAGCLIVFMMLFMSTPAFTASKPNILIIWGDDIGYWNVSAYNQGMMDYKTPNIDRIANDVVHQFWFNPLISPTIL